MTAKQLQLLRYICGYQEAHGRAPTFDDLEAIGIGRQNAHERMVALEEQGYIRRQPCKARAIEVLRPVPVPRAPDGAPLYIVPGIG